MNCKCDNFQCPGEWKGECARDDVDCKDRLVNGRRPITNPDTAADFTETTRRVNGPYNRTREDDRITERYQ